MGFISFVYYLSDNYLIYPLVFILILSFIISIKLGFVQIKAIPTMFKMLFFNKADEQISSAETISPRTALLIGMSTSLGLGNIAGPIVALGMGGPAALSGFVIASVLGAATTFLEIFLAIKYRVVDKDGSVLGGPMQYLKKEFGLWLAQFYAGSLFLLLMFWTANQANSLSILLEPAGINRLICGIILSVVVIGILVGGIKRVGALNDRLVPIMCITYLACTLSVIFQNLSNVPQALKMIFMFWSNKPQVAGALAGFSLSTAMRWGISRAIQSNEVGIGTATFPHSSSSNKNPYYQAVLGMVPVYATVFLTTLTGVTILVTDFWKAPDAVFNISMFFKIMSFYFPKVGPAALLFCGFLFAFGTILGNCYNAGRCYSFLFRGKAVTLFYVICGLFVSVGSIVNVKLIWTIVDFFVLPVAIPHMMAIFIITFKSNIFQKKNN